VLAGLAVQTAIFQTKQASMSSPGSFYLTQWKSPYWEADSRSASQEIPHLSWNANVCCRVHTGTPPLAPVLLTHLNPVHTTTPYFLTVGLHFNIAIPSTPRCSEQPLSLCLSNKNASTGFHRSNARYMPCPSNCPLFHHSNTILWRVWIMKVLMQFPSASCHFIPYSRGGQTQWSALKTENLSRYTTVHHLTLDQLGNEM
jgi:hypothetical protein